MARYYCLGYLFVHTTGDTAIKFNIPSTHVFFFFSCNLSTYALNLRYDVKVTNEGEEEMFINIFYNLIIFKNIVFNIIL